ncbi:hypothetical protein OS175_08965 [Marinicella sp. S1101]|uniref:hypothetical protein n=1 Tax=Marinicella marina TaxID=2996016 RepID=UPI00226091E2|nr:hypothetical protein [Marinicella marina]MCX7554006.1 hypothetical protein [Marinicella marina]MDJ1140498.1 hypothetical protein [Marinicella marina]
MNKKTIILINLFLISQLTVASDVEIPHTFTPNTPASADQVNENFQAIETAVDDNDTRLDDLITLVGTLQNDLADANNAISTLQQTVLAQQNNITQLESTTNFLINENSELVASLNDIENNVDTINSNSVLTLDGYLSLGFYKGLNAAVFEGINVQINDGSGDTEGATNGLGNLIVGYNEDATSPRLFCSTPGIFGLGQCTDAGGTILSNVYTGSHNIITGKGNSYTSFGGTIGGNSNILNTAHNVILTGFQNITSGGLYTTITTGQTNSNAGAYAIINGGANALITLDSTAASITGGEFNVADTAFSTVSGGDNNYANGQYSTISGGSSNSTSGVSSTVSGGAFRTASGQFDWVAGSLFEDN